MTGTYSVTNALRESPDRAAFIAWAVREAAAISAALNARDEEEAAA